MTKQDLQPGDIVIVDSDKIKTRFRLVSNHKVRVQIEKIDGHRAFVTLNIFKDEGEVCLNDCTLYFGHRTTEVGKYRNN